MSTKPLVYISSPYTKGDQEKNLMSAFYKFIDFVNEDVVVPVAPLAMQAIHDRIPQSYEFWMRYDLGLVRKCKAVFAMDAAIYGDVIYTMKDSAGRAREIEEATRYGIPVFWHKSKLYNWAKSL